MEQFTPTPEQAREALANVDAARREVVAPLADCPPWRHAAFGAVMGLLITGAGFPLEWQTASLVCAMAGVVWIKKWDESRYGVFINGYRRGATLPFTLLLLAIMLGLLWLQFHLRDEGTPVYVPLAVGFGGFLVGTVASVIWGRIFRREMEARA